LAGEEQRSAGAGHRRGPRERVPPDLQLLSRDDLAALVLPAVGADRVRPPRLAAARAGREHRSRQGQVGPASVATGLGDAFFGKCHDGTGVYQEA